MSNDKTKNKKITTGDGRALVPRPVNHPAVSTVVLDMIQYSLSILYDNRRPMHDQTEGRNTVYVRYFEVTTWRQKHTATRIGIMTVLHPAHTTLRYCLAILDKKNDHMWPQKGPNLRPSRRHLDKKQGCYTMGLHPVAILHRFYGKFHSKRRRISPCLHSPDR
jgi:hypothetical protein